MKAVVFHGAHDYRFENVPDPCLLHPKDAIVRITTTTICGTTYTSSRTTSRR